MTLRTRLILALAATLFLARGGIVSAADVVKPANVYGPYVVNVQDLPAADPAKTPALPPRTHLEASTQPYPIDETRDETVEANRWPVPAPKRQASLGAAARLSSVAPATNSILSANATWLQPYEPYDYIGASNGTVVVSEAQGNLYFTDMNSATVHAPVFIPNIHCGGAIPPPACSFPGGFADHRLFYDKLGGRWILVSLYAFGTTYRPVPNFVAVSQTTDPTGSWNVYQIPTCGPADVTDLSDQPHVGFNKHWIAINSACTTALGGHSLQVLHKDTLYAAGTVTMGSTWWQFDDIITNNDGRLDHPAATYTNVTRKLWLVHAQLSGTNTPQHVYSHISGSEFAPFVTWNVKSVTVAGTPVAAGTLAAANAPGCTGCLLSFLFSNVIQSASVIDLPDGDTWHLSASVWKYPTYANSNISTFVASNLTDNTSVASNIGDQPGVGMMAAAITAPFQSGIPGAVDPVFILWASSASNFYPGLQYYVWDVSSDTLVSGDSWPGTQAPSGCTVGSPCRWVDFVDLAAPVKITVAAPAGTVLLGGPVARTQNQTRLLVTQD